MMEYFIFTKWRVAFNVLQDGYDTYGCYRLPPYPKPCYLYAGNFWWVRSDYVLRLPPFPKNKIATNRFIAEECDWGFTRFTELRKIYTTQEGQTRPILESDAADVSVFVRVLEDPTGVLWHNFVKCAILTSRP